MPSKVLILALQKRNQSAHDGACAIQDNNLRTGVATNQVQEYSSALDMWILKAPMANARFRADVTYAEGHVIIFGGASSSLCADDGSGLEVLLSYHA